MSHTKKLIRACRVPTGIYALVMVYIGFSFYKEPISPALKFLVAVTYAGITMSIMMINDIVDYKRDVIKGKTFARDNPEILKSFWVRLNTITILLLLTVSFFSPLLGIYCAGVWIVGIIYSYIPKLLLVNTSIVALCSGSPALVGWVHHRTPSQGAMMTFIVFALLIFWDEVFKDAEDMNVDKGNKATLPTTIGYSATFVFLISCTPALMIPLLYHTNTLVSLLAFPIMSLILFSEIYAFALPEKVGVPQEVMRYTVLCLIFALIFAP